MTYDEVRSALLLQRLAESPAGKALLADSSFSAFAHAESADAEMVLGYLDNLGDAARTAETLGVHPNTVRYRLRRIQSKLGISLADADDRLVLWLQLRLLHSKQVVGDEGSAVPLPRGHTSQQVANDQVHRVYG